MKKQTNKKVKKRYFLLFGFFVAIVWSLYKLIFLMQFSYMKEIEINNGRIDATIEKRFNKGCYDIGFYANDNRFHSPAYLPYKVEGKYEFEFYHENILLSKKVIERGTELGHAYSKGGITGASSSIILYVIETPLKNHTKLTIKLKSIELENRLKDVDSVYLYIDKHKGFCGEKRINWMNKRNNPIEKIETNEILKPLYRALVTKNSHKVKELIENNLSVNIEMVGKRTPIHYGAFYNDEKVLQYLISKNAKLNEKDLTGKTPLHYAIEHNSTKALEILLDAGADFSLVKTVDDKYFLPSRAPKNSRTTEEKLVDFLIERNMVDLMKILLRKRYLDIDSDFYRYCLNGMRCERTQLDFLLSWQEIYEDPRERKRWKVLDYSKMIKLLQKYGAKRYQELEKENNRTKGNKDGK